MTVMDKPIEQSGCHFGIPEHAAVAAGTLEQVLLLAPEGVGQIDERTQRSRLLLDNRQIMSPVVDRASLPAMRLIGPHRRVQLEC
jgi:hypothetical protein